MKRKASRFEADEIQRLADAEKRVETQCSTVRAAVKEITAPGDILLNVLASAKISSAFQVAALLTHFEGSEHRVGIRIEGHRVGHTIVASAAKSWGELQFSNESLASASTESPSASLRQSSPSATLLGTLAKASTTFAQSMSKPHLQMSSGSERTKRSRDNRAENEDELAGVGENEDEDSFKAKRQCGCAWKGPHVVTCVHHRRRRVVSERLLHNPKKRRDCGCALRGAHQQACALSSRGRGAGDDLKELPGLCAVGGALKQDDFAERTNSPPHPQDDTLPESKNDGGSITPPFVPNCVGVLSSPKRICGCDSESSTHESTCPLFEREMCDYNKGFPHLQKCPLFKGSEGVIMSITL